MAFASDDLRKEHVDILLAVEILEGMAAHADSLSTVEVSDVVNFLRLFADKCHHGKEEGLMFPALEKIGMRSQGGPIGDLLKEHEKGRRFMAKMDAAAIGDNLHKEAFAAAARDYADLMRPHILQENNVVFPVGDRNIPMQEQAELLEKFELFEMEVIGEGVHDTLHETLHALHEKYAA